MTTSPKPTKDELLKPCPFCGGNASFDHDDDGWNWIVCGSCGACTNARASVMDDCKPLLAEQWNKRTTILEALAQPAADDKAEEEILQLIHERDHREEIINQLCDAVLGTDRSEWSSAYHFEDAVREVEEQMADDDKAGGDKTVVWIGKMDFEALKNRGRVTATLYNEPVGNASNEIPLYTRSQPQADYNRGWNDGYKHGAWASKPQAAQPAERVALTDEQIWGNDEIMAVNSKSGLTFDVIKQYVRAIEAAHGITAKDQS